MLSRHKVPFKACLNWLVEMAALTAEQAGRLDDIYRHRNDLSHELSKYIVDPHLEPDIELFLEALAILQAAVSLLDSGGGRHRALSPASPA